MADKNGELPSNNRYLGNQFRLWREQAGVKREAAAEAVGYSLETVKSVEYGRRRCPPPMALIGDELFGARGKLKAGLDYQAPEKYAPKAEDFIVVEQKAAWISTYEGAHVPGLLQTPEYARALMEDRCPPLSDNTIEHRVAARMERRQLLAESADPPVEYSCVLLEVVLRMPVGGRDVHRRQASWLLEAGRQRNVSIQVLPFERVTSSALAGPLVVLETKEEEQFGYLEVHMHGSLTNSREEVNALLRRHGKIRMRALSDEDSARLIERMVEEL